MTKPNVGDTNWGTTLNAHLDTLAPLTRTQRTLDADSNGVVGTSSSCWSQLNTVLASAASLGIPEVVLRSASYDFTGGTVLVPAGVTLSASNRHGTTIKGGAYPIVNKGVIRDVTLDAGWSSDPSPLVTQTGNLGGVAIIGGRVENVTRTHDATLIFPLRRDHGLLPNTVGKLRSGTTDSGAQHQRLHIGIYGMSLMEGAGQQPYWNWLLFDPTYNVTTGSAVLGAGAAIGATSINVTTQIPAGIYILDAGTASQEWVYVSALATGAGSSWTANINLGLIRAHSAGATLTGVSSKYVGAYFNLQFSRGSSINRLDVRAVGTSRSPLLVPHMAVTRDMLNSGGSGLNVADGTRWSNTPHIGDYDLIIIGDLVNDNSAATNGNAWFIESFVKTARDAGVEVILVNENSSTASPDTMKGFRELYQRIAAAYGCVHVDLATAYQVAALAGDVVASTDLIYQPDGNGVHQTIQAQYLWAEQVLNALLDHDPRIPYTYRAPKRRIYQQPYVTAGMPQHTVYEARYTPTAQSAGVTSIAATGTDMTGVKNPRYHKDLDSGQNYTSTLPSTPITRVPTGEWVEYAVEEAYDLILVTESNAATVTITTDGGATNVYTGWPPSGSNPNRLFAERLGRSTAAAKFHGKTVRVAVTSGTLNLVAACFEVPPKRGPFRTTAGGLANAKRTGTWSNATSTSAGLTGCDVTDTIGDKIEVDVVGDSVWIALGQSAYAGQVSITVDDNVVVKSSQELYSASATGVWSLCVPSLGQGTHRVTITLTGVNGSATAVSGAAAFGHRLTVLDVSGILSDNRSTLADLTAPVTR